MVLDDIRPGVPGIAGHDARACADPVRKLHRRRDEPGRKPPPRRRSRGHEPGHAGRAQGQEQRTRPVHDLGPPDRHVSRTRARRRASRPSRRTRSVSNRASRRAWTSRCSSAWPNPWRSPASRRSCRRRTRWWARSISGTTIQAMPLNGRNFSQLSLLLPGVDHHGARQLHPAQELRRGPSVRERPAGADEQLHARRRRHERADRQPAALPAEPRRAGGGTRRDQQLLRRVRQRGGRDHQQHDQVGHERVPRQLLRVLARQQPGRELVGEQSRGAGRREGRAVAAHLRGHDRRPDRAEQGVLLRRLPGLHPRPAGRAGARRWRPRRGGAATSRRSARPSATRATGQPFPGNIDPGRAASARSRGRSSPTRISIRSPTGRAIRATWSTPNSEKKRAHQGDIKIDANLSDNDRMFVRGSYQNYKEKPERRAAGEQPGRAPTTSPFLGLAFNWTRTLGANARSTSCSWASRG